MHGWHAGIDKLEGEKVGLDRSVTTYKDDEVYTFATFEEYGWTRTLTSDWFEMLPDKY